MSRMSFPKFGSVVRKAFAATALALAATSTVFADTNNVGLQMFLAEPTDFIAISEGAPGPVTHASMVGDTLLVQFLIPTHSGNAFGEVVGKVDANGVFHGNGVLVPETGRGHAAVVSLVFNDDGTIVADINGNQQDSGFLPKDAFYSY